ncbi:hypothetical protein [Cetobacterium sp. SF1]|uniref:hypothetical protein n=1 Tax=unclassified Cetobacterium TaxID=2630983 RepID=UPI003CF5B390
MKKYLITALLVLGSISVFADSDSPNEILENRVEKAIEVNTQNIVSDVDVDIAGDMANISLEIPASKVTKNYDYNALAENVVAIVKKESGITNSSVSIEIDHPISEDEVVFTKSFK